MAHPVNTINKKARLGFCSLIINERKVATRAIPIIWKISIVDPPF